MNIDMRERLIQRISRSIMWAQASQNDRDYARQKAKIIVDDLLKGSAEGKATERAIRVLEKSA